ncbi:MAG: hypothetical protein ACI4T2_04485 [Christensenellales bacterium]
MSRTNKIICYVVACVMLLCVAVLMFGCKNNDGETKVMNMSINPEVEFILDKNNKVVSVSAKNDEGNFIIAKASFDGMTAEEAAKLFVQISNENGFVAGDIQVEVSGSQAEKLLNSVKANVEVYLDQEGLNVEIVLEKINRAELEETLKDCMKELGSDEIANLTEEQVIAKIKEMRDQTKDLNTEKLKEMYYEFRAQAIEKAKFDAYIEAIQNSNIFNKDQIVAYYNELIQKIASMQKSFVDEFLSAKSEYQQKMQEFIAAKQELLQARLDEADQNVLAEKEAALKLVEEQLSAIEEKARAALETAKTTFATIKATLNAAIEQVVNNLPQSINANINVEINKTKVNFEASFKADYAEYINGEYWAGLEVKVA